VIAISKDHVGMSKFASSEDEDFQTICGYLTDMVDKAPHRITQKWILYKKSDGVCKYIDCKMKAPY
jgi:hypothetical protein